MSSAKTEEPTPRRLRELREKGEVPLSRELNKSAALLGALAAIAFAGPKIASELAALTRSALAGEIAVDAAIATFGIFGAAGALTVALSAAIAAFAAGALQTGFVLAPSRISPNAEHFRPGQTWVQRFKLDTLINATIGFLAAALATVVTWFGLSRLFRSSPTLAQHGLEEGPIFLAGLIADHLLLTVTLWVGITLLLALVDAVWQRHSFLRRNRMSLQEIRDEYKRSEGDPAHKARRSRAHRELLEGSVRTGVQRADVVVTNPTRLAVGLRYRPDEVDAPTVTVVGRGESARSIRREAGRQGVPLYEDRLVARALIELEVGEEVPPGMFEPVAVVFRWLGSLKS